MASKKERLRRNRIPLETLVSRLSDLPDTADFMGALRSDGPAKIIAEFKRRSPSRGELCSNYDLKSLQGRYEKGGADAYSVLTEEDHFGGSLEHLKSLKALTVKPVLRKDFLFTPYQLYESRIAGADAVLLIAACLPGRELFDLAGLAAELGLAALVEVHTEEELERALEAGVTVIGINNRNLHTFEVDLDTAVRLAEKIPEGHTIVSESGIHRREDIERLQEAGIHAFLIGESLVTSQDPSALLKALKGVKQ